MKALVLAALAIFGLLAAAPVESPYEPLVVTTPAPAAVQSAEASALIADVNAIRAKYNLAPVTPDDLLSNFALSYARDMAARRFFGHVTPDGASLPDRLTKAGIAWTVAAENIALDDSEAHANTALLQSPPHRANILDPRVRRIGVAALRVGVGATLYVEDFSV